MCGICGAIRLDHAAEPPLARHDLEVMTDIMTPRGPDERGLFESPGMSIGVRRLSIMDVEGGHQPFSNEDGSIWAAQNGELFNQFALRSELARDGHVLRTTCDTEIIPHLYEQYGVEFASRLRGMFAIAVWDEKRGRGVLVRDRIGVKPLYYAVRDRVVWFASELKVLLASGVVVPRIDRDALDAYLALGFVPGPMTLVAGVSKLLPGHRLVVDRAGVEDECYWEYPLPTQNPSLDAASAPAAVLELLEEAVVLRLMSDVPLGVMLSGGLDSSLIAALMARNMSGSLKTFSVGFAGQPNELREAGLMASALGADHHALEVDPAHQVDLDELAWHLDEPVADLSTLGFFELSKLAASEVTVALSGQGADELFGGYSRHRAAAALGTWDRLPAPAVRHLVARLGPARLRRLDRLSQLPAAECFAALKGVLDAERRRQLLGTAGDDVSSRLLAPLFEVETPDPLGAMLYADAKLGLVDDMLHYFDRMSMAHSLEVRVPFLDHHLVEFASRIPSQLKVRGLSTKWVLKEAAKGLVPAEIVQKRKIGFFNASVEDWVERALQGGIRETLTARDARFGDYLDAAAVRTLVLAPAAQRSRADRHLLLAISVFEHWLGKVFASADRRATAGPLAAAAVRLSSGTR